MIEDSTIYIYMQDQINCCYFKAKHVMNIVELDQVELN